MLITFKQKGLHQEGLFIRSFVWSFPIDIQFNVDDTIPFTC